MAFVFVGRLFGNFLYHTPWHGHPPNTWSCQVTRYGVQVTEFNSLVPKRCGNNFKSVIFKHVIWIKFMSTFCEIARRWMPQNAFDEKPAVVQVMALCLSQRWPRSMSSYDGMGSYHIEVKTRVATILQTSSDAFSWMKCIMVQISLTFCFNGSIDNKSAWFR